LSAYSGAAVRSTIGYPTFFSVLIVVLSVTYVVRNYDNIFAAKYKGRLLIGQNATAARIARGGSPERGRIGAPKTLKIEAAREPSPPPRRAPVAARGATPPRGDGSGARRARKSVSERLV